MTIKCKEEFKTKLNKVEITLGYSCQLSLFLQSDGNPPQI